MSTSIEYTIRSLVTQLPARIGAARSNRLDSVRLTLEEAQAVKGVLARQLGELEAGAVAARRGGRS